MTPDTTTALSLGTVERIKALHIECGSLARQTFDKAIEIGGLLVEAKAQLKHGEWGQWVEDNLPFTARSASTYMRYHDQRELLKSENVSDLTGATRMLQQQKELPAPTPAPSDFNLVPELVPADGCSLIGTLDNPDGSMVNVFIEPSEHKGYYFISYLWGAGLDQGGIAEGTKKPLRKDAIAYCITQFSRKDWTVFKWDNYPQLPRTYNVFLYDSHEDYVQQAILGRPRNCAEIDRKATK